MERMIEIELMKEIEKMIETEQMKEIELMIVIEKNDNRYDRNR